jgi:hypothetical protein
MKKKEPNNLSSALRFVGLTKAEHCRIAGHWLIAGNNIFAAGIQVQETLSCCPHIKTLALALDRCGPEYVLTQIDQGRLMARSGDFQAVVPCQPLESLSYANPDAPAAALDDRLIDSLKIVAPLASERAEYVLNASIQLKSGSCLATNNSVIMEHWHGIDLPSILLPKAAANALIKSNKQITAFGFSAESATFWYSDVAWMRTKLFSEKTEQASGFLERNTNATPIPDKFFEIASMVAPFSKDSKIACKRNCIMSFPDAAKIENLDGELLQSRIYKIADLELIAKHATMWDQDAFERATFFFGKNLRGAIFHEVLNYNPPANHPKDCTCDACDIPF